MLTSKVVGAWENLPYSSFKRTNLMSITPVLAITLTCFNKRCLQPTRCTQRHPKSTEQFFFYLKAKHILHNCHTISFMIREENIFQWANRLSVFSKIWYIFFSTTSTVMKFCKMRYRCCVLDFLDTVFDVFTDLIMYHSIFDVLQESFLRTTQCPSDIYTTDHDLENWSTNTTKMMPLKCTYKLSHFNLAPERGLQDSVKQFCVPH